MKRSDQIRIIVIFTMLHVCISCTHIMYHMICVHQLAHKYIMCKYHIFVCFTVVAYYVSCMLCCMAYL